MSKEVYKKIAVCIPAYNRAKYLPDLLDSILNQRYSNFYILICEDFSPERLEIRKIVQDYQKCHKGKIDYYENTQNLGYDGNLRNLISLSKADYCLFMGNDDLLCEGALEKIDDIIMSNLDCGVIVRSYATFDESPKKLKQKFIYFAEQKRFLPGVESIKLAFRRSVVIPGMVLHRESSDFLSTKMFDGTLLYQLYLVGMILASKCVIFTPEIISLRRDGVDPDFGNSEVEKGAFTPKEQTVASSLKFIAGMLRIAKYIEVKTGLNVYESIERDLGNYSYPLLSIQSDQSLIQFIRYFYALLRFGFWKYFFFYIYFLGLLIFKKRVCDWLIIKIKSKLKTTPMIS